MSVRGFLRAYRKDPRFIITVPLIILASTSLIYYAVQRAREMSTEALSSQVLLFVLANINVLLIFGILFVLLRGIVKLVLERQRGIIGSRFRTKLAVAWVATSLIPVLILFFFATDLLRGIVKLVLERQRGIIGSRFRTKLAVAWVATSLIPVLILFFFATDLLRVSIDRWFNTPVRRILSNGEAIARMAEDQSAEKAAAAARELAADPAAADPAQLDAILRHVQEFHSVDMVGVYRDGTLLKVVANPRSPIQEVPEPPRRFFDEVASRGHAIKIDAGASGSWIRSGARIAAGPSAAVAGVFIPATMSRLIDESIIAHKNFQQLDAQRPTLKASQTSLFLAVTLAILFGTLWTSIYASRRITIPIKALAEATSRLAEGGYGHRVEVPATDEVGGLIESFNSMSTQLDEQRKALTHTNRYLSTVLDSVSAGIIAFTDSLQLLSINRAALRILQIDGPLADASLRELLGGDLTPLFNTLRELITRGNPTREVTLIRGGEIRYLEVSVARLSGGGDEGWVAAFEDSTQLVQAQKLAAWNEAARRIAHEIKNPLTPIQLSAERIARKYRQGDADTAQAIDEGTRTIVAEVSQLKRMVDEFSRFARMPAVHLRHARLAEVLEQAASLYRDHKPGVTIRVAVDPELELLLDPEQISRAMSNLLKNAVEATDCGEICLSAKRVGRRVMLEVADPGRGVTDSDKQKLFLPYFSTKGRGTGLGLAIVHRIVNDHDGRISVHDNHPRGTRFEIELPG